MTDPEPSPPRATPDAASGLAAAVFYLLGACSLGFAIWVFGIERHFYSRLPLVPAALGYLAFAYYFHRGARPWISAPRSKRRWAVICLVCLVLTGPVALVVVPGTLVAYGAFRGLDLVLRGVRWPAHWWTLPRQLGVLLVLCLLVSPWLNRLYLFHGVFYLFGAREPPRLMENARFEVNADGLRGARVERARDRERAPLRLLFLGDSTTFGFPYRNADAYPARVGARLDAAGLGPVEIVNAAIPSQSLVQIEARLDELLAFEPDYVLLMSGIQYYRSIEHRQRIDAGGDPLLDVAVEWVFLPPFVPELIQAGPLRTLRSLRGGDAGWDDLEGNLALHRASLERVARRVADSPATLVLLEYPALDVPEAIRAHYREAAAVHGVALLPLAHLFTAKHEYAFDDGIHPLPEGHERVAARVAEHLIGARAE